MNFNVLLCWFFFLTLGVGVNQLHAQDYVESPDTSLIGKTVIVLKNDGSEYIGILKKMDAREVLIETKTIGDVYIPKHEIKSISEADDNTVSSGGKVIRENRMYSRYFITTSGMPIERGDDYLNVTWGLVDAEFRVAKNFSLGGMTTPLGIPMAITPKLGFSISDNLHIGAGGIVGFLGWIQPNTGGALGYGTITLGDKDLNLNVAVGGAIGWGDGFTEASSVLLSVGSHIRLGPGAFFVFDSFMLPQEEVYIFMPGFRWITKKNQDYWSLAFTGVVANGQAIPIPIPFLQYTHFFRSK